jgi:type IX secretion system PorP/SprF family membrane protein
MRLSERIEYRREIIIRSICILAIAYGSALSLWSQDVDFSLYKFNPLFLNPANTGNFYGSLRITANYRNQWAATSSPFTTASASLDKRFKISNQDFAVGIIFLNDEAGVGGITYNKLFGSVSYSNNIGKNFFYGGLQVGYVFGSVNSWYNWNQTTGDYTAPSGEDNFGENTSYLDINAGIIWKSKISIFEPEIGFAISHLNSPSNSFLAGEDEKETMKYTIHFDLKTNLTDRIYISPAIAYFGREGASLTMVGTDIGYNFPGNKSTVKSFYTGLFLRNGILTNLDALSLMLGTTIGRLDIGLGYDMNISNLRKSSGSNLGAFEVSIMYRIVGVVLNSYSIPCERY